MHHQKKSAFQLRVPIHFCNVQQIPDILRDSILAHPLSAANPRLIVGVDAFKKSTQPLGALISCLSMTTSTKHIEQTSLKGGAKATPSGVTLAIGAKIITLHSFILWN